MKKIKLSQYAKDNGLTYRTALRHFHDGILQGEQLPTGSIFVYLPEEQKVVSRGAALYSRVSSSENKDNLQRQQQRLEDYAAARGYSISNNVAEVGSGLNDARPKMIKLLQDNSWDVLIVEHKDRLTRFGFNYLEVLLAKEGRRIEVINVSEDKEDLMEDFVSVITSFCARIYGQRRTKRMTEKIIEEAKSA